MQCFSINCDIYSLLVLFFLVVTLTKAAPNPTTGSCDESQPECLRNTIQRALPGFIKGVPELGVEVLDPFYIEKLDLTLSGGLRIQFGKGHARGTRKCVVEQARVLQDTIETRFLCNVTMKGKYKSSGRLLMFPINGDGDAMVKCKNLRIKNILKVKPTTASGITYLEVVNSTTSHSYGGRIQFNLTNLFKGSPETSQIVLEFMNQSWQLVAEEFGDPIVEFGVSTVLTNIKKLFSAVPMNQLFETWEPVPTK